MKKMLDKFLAWFRSDALLPRKLLLTMIGVSIMGVAVSATIYSNLGSDPCTCINLALAAKLHMAFWQWSCIVNSILILFPLFFDRSLIGLGTLANMYLISIIADGLRVSVYKAFLPAAASAGFGLRAVFMVMGVVLLCIGAAFYMVAGTGVAPYDAIPLLFTHWTHWPFRWVRMGYDITAVLLGWLLGGPVGFGTVLIAFGLGPIIHSLGKWIQKKYLASSGGVKMN